MTDSGGRNFQTFKLSDNIHELAGGLLPEIMDRVGQPPESDISQNLNGLAERLEGDIELEPALILNFIDRSGVMAPLDRSLWQAEKPTPRHIPRIIIADNDQELRIIQLMMSRRKDRDSETYALSCATDDNMDAAASDFVSNNPNLFGWKQRVSFVGMASTGLQAAIRFREAARDQIKARRYDTLQHNPQVFVETIGQPIDLTTDGLRNGLRQVVRTAEMIHEAAGGDPVMPREYSLNGQ